MNILTGALFAAALALGGAAQAQSSKTDAKAAAQPQKVLRYAFNTAETGFDPARIVDLYSRIVTAHIFESLYTYDYLARPSKVRPQIADGMPVHSEDFRTWTVKIRPGIHFADDPVFGGKKREVTAADFVYAYKRFADPETKSPVVAGVLDQKYVGLLALREKAIAQKTPFDYDTEIEGIRALDRYTIQFKLEDPRPRFLDVMASNDLFGAVAREVVEHYGDAIPAHPVGTGPFRLAQWRRSSLIVLERNPGYRERYYEAEPAADDVEGQALLAKYQGRRIPMVDRVEISIIEEAQPRWLAFLGGQHDVLTLPPDFGDLAMPGGELAPFLKRQGVHAERVLSPSVSLTFINCIDPTVGGLTPERVALRRAIHLAYDANEENRVVRRGQSVLAQSLVPPGCFGHDPQLVSTTGFAQPARANALLDMHGYVDRNRDGWREQPDGQPLVLRMAFRPDRSARAISELWHKRLRAVGLRVEFEFAPFGELIRKTLAGQLMMWGFSWTAGEPDGDFFLGLAYGPNAGQSNDARFDLPAFNQVYEAQTRLPNGPERLALMAKATRLMLSYVPYIPHGHSIDTDLFHPQVQGPYGQPFSADWYRWVDVRPAPSA